MITRSRTSKNDKQYNGQNKGTNNAMAKIKGQTKVKKMLPTK